MRARYMIPSGLGAMLVLCATFPAQAQSNSDRLLDSLVRGMQICSEINDSASRLDCYDEVYRTTAAGESAIPAQSVPPPPGYVPSSPGSPGFGYPPQQAAPGGYYDPDRAFDPRTQRVSTVPPEMLGEIIGERRSGPGPIPRGNVPLVTLGTPSLNYNEADYRWQVTASLTNNTGRMLDASVTCTLNSNDRKVTDMNWFPNGIRSGETVSVDMLGPSTSAFANSVTCRVNYPI